MIEAFDTDQYRDRIWWVNGFAFNGGGRRISKVFSDPKSDVAVVEFDVTDLEIGVDLVLPLMTTFPSRSEPRDTDLVGFENGLNEPVVRPVQTIGYDGGSMTRILQSSVADGMSGSPAVLDGEVWGIVRARHVANGESFIIPIQRIMEWLLAVPGWRESAGAQGRNFELKTDIEAVVDRLWRPLFRKIRLETEADFQSMEAFFKHVLRRKGDGSVGEFDLQWIVGRLCAARSFSMVRLWGAQGAGKSTTMQSLSAVLRNAAAADPNAPIPIFIDAEKYLREPPAPVPAQGRRRRQSTERQRVNQLIKHDFETLKAAIDQTKEKNFVLLLDGLASDNIYSEETLKRAFDLLDSERLSGIAIAMSESWEKKLGSVVDNLGAQPEIHDVELTAISLADPSIEDYLYDFVALFDQLRGITSDRKDIAARRKNFSAKLHLFGFADIDVHVASVIFSKLDDPAYTNIRNLTDFLEAYARERLQDVSTEDPGELLNSAAALAMEITRSAGADSAAINVDPSIVNLAAWSFIREHSNYRDFLTALHIVSLLRDASRDEETRRRVIAEKLLALDFTETVNQFVKKIINAEEEILSQVYKAVVLMHEDADLTTASFFYYLLGRFEKPGPAKLAAEFLKKRREELDDALEETTDSKKRLRLLVLLRTTFISLIYLGKEDVANDYIAHLLTHQDAAAINRGFHRIYYGDSPASRRVGEERYLDDGGDWRKSREALYSRITKHMSAAKAGGAGNSVLFEINLFTLISFTQHGFVQSAIEPGILNKVRKLVTECRDEVRNWNLVAYLESCEVDFGRGEASRWRFLVDLYQLKRTMRQGWVDRNIGEDDPRRIESISEHSHLAYLMAHFLLPPELPKYEDYDKNSVLKMLLVHDLAEAYIGDHVVGKLTPDQRKEYLAKEASAMHYIRMKDTYNGVYDAAEAFIFWHEFENHRSSEPEYINARIAKDFDRFENFVQLALYRPRLQPEQYERFKEALSVSFETDVVQEMAQDFAAWVSTQGDQIHQRLNAFVPSFGLSSSHVS